MDAGVQTVGRRSAVIAAIVLLMSAQLSFAGPVQKKVVYYGWGTPDTQYVRDHWREMENAPLDGTAISVAIDRSKPTTGDGSTANLVGWSLFGPKAFGPEVFESATADLKAPKWSKFKTNFLIACICSAGQDEGFDWFDDKRWKTIIRNWRMYVRLAKESGLKGIIIDPEQYGSDHGADASKGYFFSYKEMKRRNPVSFEEMRRKVRQRGRELMRAAAKEFPDMEIPMLMASGYVWYTQLQNWYAEDKNAPCPIELNHYVLLPALIDGMLEGSDKRTRFIDLSEPAYGSVQRESFLTWYHCALGKAPEYSDVPDLYRARVSVGLPVWIDCAFYDKGWDTADFSKNYYTPESLKEALKTAIDVTDEYVWIYAHKPCFFPASNFPEAYMSAVREAQSSGR